LEEKGQTKIFKAFNLKREKEKGEKMPELLAFKVIKLYD